MHRLFPRRSLVPDGIRPLDFSKFDYEPSKLSPKLSQLVPKFHGEWDESAIQHLDAFYTFIEDYDICSEDQVMKLFARTLKDNARQAYESLPTQCISSWKEFEGWFLYEFHDAGYEEEMRYEQYENQGCNMEEDPDMSPLDVFFNTKRYEGETSAHLFLRVLNTYNEIPSNIKPPYMEFLNKIVKLKISPKDPDVKLLLQIWDQAIKDEAKDTKVKQENNEVLDIVEIQEKSNHEEDSLSVDEISTLLDMEYQKYVERGGQIFLSINKENQIKGVSYETFNEYKNLISTKVYHFHEEEINEPEGSCTSREDGILVEDVRYDLSTENNLFGYNFKEISDPIYNGLAEKNEEYSPYTFLDFEDSVNIHEEEENTSNKDCKITSDLLFNEIMENPDIIFCESEVGQHEEISNEGSFENIPKVSFLSPLCEDEILDQINQHNDDMPKDDSKNNENHSICGAVYSKEEPFSNPFYDQYLHLEYENEMQSNKEDVVQIGAESSPNILPNQIFNKTETIFSMTDKKHKGILFSMDYNVPKDLSKAKQESDTKVCIHEAETVSITHNYDVCDTGMRYEKHTEVSIHENYLMIFIEKMLSEMFLSIHHISFKDFSFMYTNQINEVRNHTLELNNQIDFFLKDPIDKANINSNLEQEKHKSYDAYLLFTDKSDFIMEQYDVIFSKSKVLSDQSKVFDRGKK